MTAPFVNIAGYKFVPLDDLEGRRKALLARTRELELKGSILLSSEGLNMFLAGDREKMDLFLSELRSQTEFADLETKESFSDHQPFSRMLVRLKKEIISMGVEEIVPARKTSPKISAQKLKQWLDEGKPLTLLDVRNDYEVDIGTFKDALPIGIDSFREFPKAIKALPGELKERPVVMFCTGGIRCEKAGPLMEGEGYENVFQLNGGILKYFEECGGEHYNGECFVFDKRVALDPDLQETETEQCYACQAVLTPEDQTSQFYVPGESCHHCYLPPEERMKLRVGMRNSQIAASVSVLPGSQPYDNIRPINISQKFDRLTTIEFLNRLMPHVGNEYWLDECAQGRITYKDQPLSAEDVVRSGWRVEHLIPHSVEPDVNGNIQLVFEDECMIAVDKPAPLPMHPCGRFNRNSLMHILGGVFSGERLRVTHRLDANTTGIVLVCRKRSAADSIRSQFQHDKIEKAYLARVHGHPEQQEFDCAAGIAAEPGANGLRLVDSNGQEALTEFVLLEKFEDGTSLVRCHPKTGRTNQIRIHLWHLGFPILGDPSYLQSGQTGQAISLTVDDEPMCLHAHEIRFFHPVSKEPMTLAANPPVWCKADVQGSLS